MDSKSFARSVTVCCRLFAAIACMLLAMSLAVGLQAAGQLEKLGIDLSRGALVGFGILMLAAWLAALLRWSLFSHALAVEHGMIPRWSSAWAVFGWVVPLVHFVVPFAMLGARWRFYGVDARRVMHWLQALFTATVVLWAWVGSGIRETTAPRWSPLALAASALFVWRLRGVVLALSAVQQRAGVVAEVT